MPLLVVLFCQGLFQGQETLYRVEAKLQRPPFAAPVEFSLVDLGWRTLEEARVDSRYQIIGNLQAYQGSRTGGLRKLGDFKRQLGTLTLTIEYPMAKPLDTQWRLHFWGRTAEGKTWIPLEVDGKINPALKPAGIEIAGFRHGAPLSAPAGRGLRLEVEAWPEDDIIIAWDN